MTERNPIIVPKSSGSSTKTCWKCGKADWTGRNIQGAFTFTCKACGAQWHGGLPQVAQDPSEPVPAERYEPTVRFVENKTSPGGVEEIRRRPDMRPDFKKGAPIPEDEE